MSCPKMNTQHQFLKGDAKMDGWNCSLMQYLKLIQYAEVFKKLPCAFSIAPAVWCSGTSHPLDLSAATVGAFAGVVISRC